MTDLLKCIPHRYIIFRVAVDTNDNSGDAASRTYALQTFGKQLLDRVSPMTFSQVYPAPFDMTYIILSPANHDTHSISLDRLDWRPWPSLLLSRQSLRRDVLPFAFDLLFFIKLNDIIRVEDAEAIVCRNQDLDTTKDRYGERCSVKEQENDLRKADDAGYIE